MKALQHSTTRPISLPRGAESLPALSAPWQHSVSTWERPLSIAVRVAGSRFGWDRSMRMVYEPEPNEMASAFESVDAWQFQGRGAISAE